MKRAITLIAAMLFALAMMVGPAAATLCIAPHGETLVTAPLAPEDFADRGDSMSNSAGKLAAWEAHFNSPVVYGPDEELHCP